MWYQGKEKGKIVTNSLSLSLSLIPSLVSYVDVVVAPAAAAAVFAKAENYSAAG